MATPMNNTGNGVGSTDPRDLMDNAQVLDRLINGLLAKYTDRLGRERRTWAGFEAELDAIVSSLDTSNFTYPDVAAGLAATTNGQYFRVPQGAGMGFVYYRNASGLPVAVAETTGKKEAKALADNNLAGLDIVQYVGDGPAFPTVFGLNNEVLQHFDSIRRRISYLGQLKNTDVTALSETVMASADMVLYTGSGPVYPVVMGANNVAALYYNADTGMFGGAIAGSDKIVRSPLVPLATELTPVARAVNFQLGYGQSLIVGANGLGVISVTQPYYNRTFGSGPRAAGGDYSTQKPLVEDALTAPDGGTNRGETVCSGAANYASTLMATENGIDPASHVIFSSTAGKGGTRIADLGKGSAWYASNLLGHINGAVALNPVIACHTLMFSQGESENDLATPTSYATYLAALEQLQVDAETDIKARTGQASPVHFIITQTNYKARTSAGVCLAQLAACLRNPKFHLVSPNYFLPHAGDGTHLTNVGYKWQGAYFARAYKTLVIDKCVPQYIRPLSATLRGTTLTLKLDVPVLPLRLDKSQFSTQDSGFCVKDASGNTVAVSAIATSGNTVMMTLASVPASALTLRYALDYLASELNIINGASGNLRDSCPDTINVLSENRHLYNWCPAFSLPVIKIGE